MKTLAVFSKLPQLRIAVNSRCDRFCLYCRPSGEGLATTATAKLSLEAVLSITRAFAELGGKAVKITGGDPALWPPLVEAVSGIKAIPSIQSIDIISRHPKIGDVAPALAKAGASLLNLSIDTKNPQKHRFITGVDDLSLVLEALEKCLATGLTCKVNTVVMGEINDMEIEEFAEYLARLGVSALKLLDVIHDLDSGEESYAKRLAAIKGKTLRELYIPLNRYIDAFRDRVVNTEIVSQGQLGHPMTQLKLDNGLTVIVKDHKAGAWYGSICRTCPHYPCHDALMAIRLTADSRLQPCLLNAEAAVNISANGGLKSGLKEMLEMFDSATFEVHQIMS